MNIICDSDLVVVAVHFLRLNMLLISSRVNLRQFLELDFVWNKIRSVSGLDEVSFKMIQGQTMEGDSLLCWNDMCAHDR